MLTKYGTSNIVAMLVIAAIFLVIAIFTQPLWLRILLISLGSILAIFTFIFFRDPNRTIPERALTDSSLIISPADGKVVEITNIDEKKFLKSKAIQISIFLSPLDVHVNRSPANGVVKYFTYIKGDYLVAFHPKSSEKNEQTHIGIENSSGKVLFKQIVGILARRLVWDIKEGDSLTVGQRFGMMKFGSRMDVIVPVGSSILVNIGGRVVAGETFLAQLHKE